MWVMILDLDFYLAKIVKEIHEKMIIIDDESVLELQISFRTPNQF